MIGKRLTVYPDGSWDMPQNPGEYVGPVDGKDGYQYVYFLKPNARDDSAPACARSVHCVRIPPHRLRECEDGSLEIRESIGATAQGRTESDGWHGYLDEGHVWRQVGE